MTEEGTIAEMRWSFYVVLARKDYESQEQKSKGLNAIFCVQPFRRKDFQFYKKTLAFFYLLYYNT